LYVLPWKLETIFHNCTEQMTKRFCIVFIVFKRKLDVSNFLNVLRLYEKLSFIQNTVATKTATTDGISMRHLLFVHLWLVS
jgi:hypothetical protein